MAQRDIPNPEDLKTLYPSNSYSRDADEPTEQPKEVRQVTQGKVHKQGFIRRLGRSIIEDSIETAKEKAFGEIVVPGFKTLIFDTLTEILNLALFGEGGYRGTQAGPARRSDRTSYREFYDRKNGQSNREVRTAPIPFDPDDIVVRSRAEGTMVLDELSNIINRYGQASVADFYDIVGVTSDWTDNRYGWTDIREASIRPVREGFMLMMPRTKVLDN